MIPDLAILGRRKYRSAFDASSYNPRTLFTQLNFQNDFSGGDALLDNTFEYNATLIHERTHWMQHHGTSFGAFLDAVRFSQEHTALRWIRSLPQSRIERLVDGRFQSNEPVLRIDQGTQLPVYELSETDDELDIFRQIWFDHQWVHSVFEDSSICDAVGRPPAEAIGEVVADVVLDLSEEPPLGAFNLSQLASDQVASREWYRFPDKIIFFGLGKSRLTSRMLMETAATISEIEVLRSGPWISLLDEKSAKNALRRRLRSLLEGEYGVAFRALLTIYGAESDEIITLLPTASALCFAALNPPLPPYTMSGPEHRKSWRWSEIYPPSRFKQLCEAVPKVGILKAARDHRTLHSYIHDLCRVANIPCTLDVQFPNFVPHASTPDFSDRSSHYPDTLALTHQDYNLWVQSRLASLRQHSLPLFVSLGDCLSGELCKEYSAYFLSNVNGDAVPFAESPLLGGHGSDGKVGFRCPKDFGNWLVRSTAMQSAVFDFIVGAGEFDLRDFPKEVQAQAMQDMLKNNLIDSLLNHRNTD